MEQVINGEDLNPEFIHQIFHSIVFKSA